MSDGDGRGRKRRKSEVLTAMQIEVGLALLAKSKPVWASVLCNELAGPTRSRRRGHYSRVLNSLYDRRLINRIPDYPCLPSTHYRVRLNSNGLEIFGKIQAELNYLETQQEDREEQTDEREHRSEDRSSGHEAD